MFVKAIARASCVVGVVSIGMWASAASSQPQAQVEEVTYRPIDNVRFDFGSKSMSGYFVQQAARCVVSLMVYERPDPDAASKTATRLRLVLNPGETAGLDSEEGRSVNLTCGSGATALVVDSGEREELVELQKLPLRKAVAINPMN
jgi:hypothetical protein